MAPGQSRRSTAHSRIHGRVFRNLLLGPQRYSDLLRELPGITTNLLAKRLQEMEARGVIEKSAGPSNGPAQAYRLTSLGLALQPAISALAAGDSGRCTPPDVASTAASRFSRWRSAGVIAGTRRCAPKW